MGKVTMQSIADALGISRVTVWKVFNNQKGVSDSLRNQVISKAQELGYSISPEVSLQKNDIKNIALVVSRPDSSTFWTSIIHSIARELSYNDMNLLYTYVPSEYVPGYTLPGVLTDSKIDAIIVINIYDNHIYNMINNLPIPKVFLDCTSRYDLNNLNGDLFLIEGYDSEYVITKSLIDQKLGTIGFLGDIEYAKTNLDRYKGYKKCMDDFGLKIIPKYIHTSRIGINSYYEEITDYLDSLDKMPEAFVCVSDFMIHFVMNYFADHPKKMPSKLLLTGFDGTDEYANVDQRFTTAYVNTDMLGKRMAAQIFYRLKFESAPYEIIYIKPQIIFRSSNVN